MGTPWIGPWAPGTFAHPRSDRFRAADVSIVIKISKLEMYGKYGAIFMG